jgi:hypothetical protein
MKRRVIVGLTLVCAWSVPSLVRTPHTNAGGTLGAAAPQVTVVKRAVVGGFVEGMTYLGGGPHKGFLAMAVGSDVLGLPRSSNGRVKPQRLFDMTAAGPRFRANGIAYIDEMDRYAVDTREDIRRGWPQHIYLFDRRGGLEQWLVVRDDGRRIPSAVEGLAYVPPSIDWPANFLGTLLMVAMQEDLGHPDAGAWIEVLTPDPVAHEFRVTSQILIPETSVTVVGSLAVLPGGEVRLVSYDGSCDIYRSNAWFWEDGANAAIVSGGLMNPCTAAIGEAITALPDGSLAVADMSAALHFIDAEPVGGAWPVVRQVDVQVGLNVYDPTGIAWDSRRDRFLLAYESDADISFRADAVGSLNLALTVWTPLRIVSSAPDMQDRNFTGLTYNATTDEIVLARTGRYVEHFPGYPLHTPSWNDTRTPALVSFPAADASAAVVITDLSGVLKDLAISQPGLYSPGAWTNGPNWVLHNPTDGLYRLGMARDANSVFVLDSARTSASFAFGLGAPAVCTSDRPIFQVSSPAAYDTLRGQYLVQGVCRRASVATPDDFGRPMLVVLDAAGSPVAQYDVFTSLGTWVDGYITSISSGPFAGSYAYLGRWTYELIVFRIR